MSLEQELAFDIQRCSSCPYAANRIFCSPTIQNHTDTFLVFDHPTMGVCESGNPWRHNGMPFLRQALLHACGGDLTRYHVTFLSKCLAKCDGLVPPMRQRTEWARVCSTRYLDREIKTLLPRHILSFGELSFRMFFPDETLNWEEAMGRTLSLPDYDVDVTMLDSLSRLQKAGLKSPSGIQLLKDLNAILGGELNLPEAADTPTLFDLF